MNPVDHTRKLAGLLQLLRRAREAESAAQLGFIMVNETRQLLDYRQAALWHEGPHGHVGALSGLVELDPTAPYLQWLDRLFSHLRQQDGGPCRQLGAADVPPALADEWATWLPAHALWLRLDGAGALLLAHEQGWGEYELKLAAELAHGYSHAWRQFAPRHNWRDRVRSWLAVGRHRRRVLLLIVVLACLPIRLSVLARAEVVPQNPRLLRAPVTGVIADVRVQPNQRVAQGTALFSLDATALSGQFELASRERDAAQESFRASAQLAVTDDKARQAMAQEHARMEEKTITADYTGRELQRLHVAAPAAGVVVFSDRSDWLGRAVTAGEKVMTLADPARVELTAWLPAGEAIAIEPGSDITLYPNAAPTESYDAEISRVAYRAEVSEGGQLAYRLQARFKSGEKPRLGQMGTARVYGDWVPMCYYLLRRPLTAARQWLGW